MTDLPGEVGQGLFDPIGWLDKMIVDGVVEVYDIPAYEDDDNRPFPLQLETTRHEPVTIPWWLAQIAYGVHVRLHQNSLSIEEIAERGGFTREDLTRLLLLSSCDVVRSK